MALPLLMIGLGFCDVFSLGAAQEMPDHDSRSSPAAVRFDWYTKVCSALNTVHFDGCRSDEGKAATLFREEQCIVRALSSSDNPQHNLVLTFLQKMLGAGNERQDDETLAGEWVDLKYRCSLMAEAVQPEQPDDLTWLEDCGGRDLPIEKMLPRLLINCVPPNPWLLQKKGNKELYWHPCPQKIEPAEVPEIDEKADSPEQKKIDSIEQSARAAMTSYGLELWLRVFSSGSVVVDKVTYDLSPIGSVHLVINNRRDYACEWILIAFNERVRETPKPVSQTSGLQQRSD